MTNSSRTKSGAPESSSISSWVESLPPPVPENEKKRVEALHRYVPRGAKPQQDKAIEKLVRLASEFCDVPIVLVNLIDEKEVFQQACFGQKGMTIARTDSICQFTIMQDDILEVKDAQTDPLFCNNPFVTGEMQLRYYASAPLRTPDGYNIGTLCLLDSKPKALNASQKRALGTLADVVVSRMEINMLNRRLQKENEAKDELLQVVSHDMRNPLMGIVGFAEYLYKETEDEEKKEIYSIMEDAGKHMLGIVNVMLNSNYLRNESFALNRQPVDVVAETQHVIALQKPFAIMKEQELQIDMPSHLTFKLDPEHWKKIIGDLLNNAIKFTPRHGHISLSLKLDQTDGKGPTLILCVQDSGMGMTDEQIKELYSGDKAYHHWDEEGNESSGLGMLLIKKNVELHRGKVSVESTPGVGTTFIIGIPE